MIHLHPPQQSRGRREQPAAAVPQDSVADEEYNDDEPGEDNGSGDEDAQQEEQSDASEAPDDSSSDDSQTDDMDEDIDDAYLYIKVIYDLEGVPGITQKRRKAGDFPTQVLFCPRNMSLPEVYKGWQG
jgi:hypothetical protein